MDKSQAIKLIRKASLRTAKAVVYGIPGLKNSYSDYYAKYRFLSCKLRQKLNILRPDATIQWLATYNCNFHCKHCEASAGRRVLELTTDEILGLMNELGGMGLKKIFISGGEPLIRKDIFRIIRYILDRGMVYGIASNGYLVSKFRKEFSEMKPVMFFTSIDGIERTNDEIRGMKGAFKSSFEALEFFESIGVEDRMVNTVVYPGNIGELPELKEVMQSSAATSWRLSLTIPVGRAKDNENMYLNAGQIKYLFGFIKEARRGYNIELTEDAGYLGCLDLELRNRPFFCDAGLRRCSIMPDGEVLGCQIAYDNRYSEGNIRDRSFREIWQSGFSRFRNPPFDRECLDCEYFGSCRGGCWGMRLGNRHCLKEIWDGKNAGPVLQKTA